MSDAEFLVLRNVALIVAVTAALAAPGALWAVLRSRRAASARAPRPPS